MTDDTIESLRRLGACTDAVDWCAAQLDPRAAWDACDRAGWMLWLLVRLDRRRGVGVLVEVVRATCAHLAADEITTDVLNPLAAWAAGDESVDVTAVEVRAWSLWRAAAAAAVYAYAAAHAHAAAAAAAAAAHAGATLADAAVAATADWSATQAAMIRDLVPYDEVEKMMREVKP